MTSHGLFTGMRPPHRRTERSFSRSGIRRLIECAFARLETKKHRKSGGPRAPASPSDSFPCLGVGSACWNVSLARSTFLQLLGLFGHRHVAPVSVCAFGGVVNGRSSSGIPRHRKSGRRSGASSPRYCGVFGSTPTASRFQDLRSCNFCRFCSVIRPPYVGCYGGLKAGASDFDLAIHRQGFSFTEDANETRKVFPVCHLLS